MQLTLSANLTTFFSATKKYPTLSSPTTVYILLIWFINTSVNARTSPSQVTSKLYQYEMATSHNEEYSLYAAWLGIVNGLLSLNSSLYPWMPQPLALINSHHWQSSQYYFQQTTQTWGYKWQLWSLWYANTLLSHYHCLTFNNPIQIGDKILFHF